VDSGSTSTSAKRTRETTRTHAKEKEKNTLGLTHDDSDVSAILDK